MDDNFNEFNNDDFDMNDEFDLPDLDDLDFNENSNVQKTNQNQLSKRSKSKRSKGKSPVKNQNSFNNNQQNIDPFENSNDVFAPQNSNKLLQSKKKVNNQNNFNNNFQNNDDFGDSLDVFGAENNNKPKMKLQPLNLKSQQKENLQPLDNNFGDNLNNNDGDDLSDLQLEELGNGQQSKRSKQSQQKSARSKSSLKKSGRNSKQSQKRPTFRSQKASPMKQRSQKSLQKSQKSLQRSQKSSARKQKVKSPVFDHFDENMDDQFDDNFDDNFDDDFDDQKQNKMSDKNKNDKSSELQLSSLQKTPQLSERKKKPSRKSLRPISKSMRSTQLLKLQFPIDPTKNLKPPRKLKGMDKDLEKYSPFYNKIKKILQQDSKSLNPKDLKKESLMLRKYLKEINTELTNLIERKGSSFFVNAKPKTFNNKPIEKQIQILTEEVAYQRRVFKTRQREHDKLKARFDLISQPGFKFKLQNQVKQVAQEIKAAKKSNRDAFQKQRLSCQALDNIEQVGKPKSLVKLHDIEYELTVLMAKNHKLKEASKNFDNKLDEQKKQLQNCFSTLKKKRFEAEKLRIKESIEMKNKFDMTQKRALALEVNAKAREKMFKNKVKSIKRDVNHCLIENKYVNQKQDLIDNEIERQEEYLLQLKSHEVLREYNVAQFLMQITLSTQGKFTSKGFKRGLKRKPNYSRQSSGNSRLNIKENSLPMNANKLSVVKSNFQGEQQKQSLIVKQRKQPNKPNFSSKPKFGKNKQPKEKNKENNVLNIDETKSKVFKTEVDQQKHNQQKNKQKPKQKDTFDLDLDLDFDSKSKEESPRPKPKKQQTEKKDDLDIDFGDFDMNDNAQPTKVKKIKKKPVMQYNQGNFEIPSLQENKPKKTKNNADDFDLDSFDLEEPITNQKKKKKPQQQEQDAFGDLDDIDFGDTKEKKKPKKPKKEVDEFDFDF